ncbi:hypothetical protein GCK72_024792 [Caenorhabditis remanei]|uniref:Uncharacterized protein n=1 Tax=Caenorhabditis remanei TaxID=31234 RepID=A0A6A5G0Z0_CAERE|nr:hypothetical protein GCK72_024792 [Caenorhabditis remanei]KAF1748325.1 hypothetical protein GCK72_024792 [Caenorhabditis remanei]
MPSLPSLLLILLISLKNAGTSAHIQSICCIALTISTASIDCISLGEVTTERDAGARSLRLNVKHLLYGGSMSSIGFRFYSNRRISDATSTDGSEASNGDSSSSVQIVGVVTNNKTGTTSKKPSDPEVITVVSNGSSVVFLSQGTAKSPQGANSRNDPEPRALPIEGINGSSDSNGTDSRNDPKLRALPIATEGRDGSSDSNERPLVDCASSTSSSMMSDSISQRIEKYNLQKKLWKQFGQPADQRTVRDKRSSRGGSTAGMDEIPPKKIRGDGEMENSAQIAKNPNPDSGYVGALRDRGDPLCLEKDNAAFNAWCRQNGFYLSLYGETLATEDSHYLKIEAWRFNGDDDPSCPYDNYGQPIPEKFWVRKTPRSPEPKSGKIQQTQKSKKL